MTARPWWLLVPAALLVSCGGSLVDAEDYARANNQQDSAFWKALLPGRDVVLTPGAGCKARRAQSLSDLDEDAPSVREGAAELLTITDARVETSSPGYVALQVKNAQGESSWLRLADGAPLGCVHPVAPGTARFAKLSGTRRVFAAHRAECVEVHAVGESPSALLLEPDAPPEFEVGSLTFGPASASALTGGGSGGTAWFEMAGGALRVRADVVERCFAPANAAEAKTPPRVTARLHLDEGRCTRGDQGDSAHVVCRTTLGVWEGTTSPKLIELRLTRRTLGTVHFVDGRPVSGTPYAKAVVAIEKGAAQDPRARAVYQALDQAVARELQRQGGDVRLVAPGSPEATYMVKVEVTDLAIGELQVRESTETTQYVTRTDRVANPDKDAAVIRVREAERALDQARRDYENAKLAREEEARRCRRNAYALSDAHARSAALSTCAMAYASGPPDPVPAANAKLREAERAYQATPAEKEVKVYADWSYKKKTFSRSTSAVLRLTMQAAGDANPKTLAIKIQKTWSDYEVQPDPAHGVAGHSPDRGPIDNPEALVPHVAEGVSRELALRLSAAISGASVQQAIKRLAESGAEAKPGFEAVDAVAFDVASARLDAAVVRGRAELAAGKAEPLPVKAATLAPGQCLLAVAVADSGAAADVRLETGDGSHADQRGGAMAVVEVCRSELSRAAVDAMNLLSQAGGAARWGLYRTREGGGS